ncbi:hypothetical protein JCGZ_14163 [Jatropha curcas]|uniref:NAC transcription factor 073 n=2 Tax=Jatropha curcas TaxID=180498 RepID=R4NG02_JATCU|nr:NAC transcription factor 073 [Jatropha curcas]KDP28392.1 hypothetical protein JCGZ_14163 [Jatropha curcas]
MSKPIGYRFHPTDEELVAHFLNLKISDHNLDLPIAEVKVCDFEPWDLPGQSKIKSDDRVWYFFCPRDLKYAYSRRSNRTTEAGFWKPTGKLRKVKKKKMVIGTKRSLVFYKKEHPKPVRTKWIMHEYELPIQGNFLVCKLKAKLDEKISKSEPDKTDTAQMNTTSGSPCESVITVDSSYGECEPTDHVGSNVKDHKLNEMTAMPTYDGGEQSCLVAFELGNPNQTEVISDSACLESELGYNLAPNVEDKNPDEMTGIRNQNYKKTDNLFSEEGEWSVAGTPDCGNQNLHEVNDMISPACGLEINAEEAKLSQFQGPPTFFDQMNALFETEHVLFEPEVSLKSAVFLPIGTEECLSHSSLSTSLPSGTGSQIGAIP